MTESTPLVQKVDSLHQRKDFFAVHKLLEKQRKQTTDVEILWRLARSYYDLACEKPNDKEWKKKYLLLGLECAEKALAINSDHCELLSFFFFHSFN